MRNRYRSLSALQNHVIDLKQQNAFFQKGMSGIHRATNDEHKSA